MYASEDYSLRFVVFLFEKMRIILLESEFRGWGEIEWVRPHFRPRDFLLGDLPFCPPLSMTHGVCLEDGHGLNLHLTF